MWWLDGMRMAGDSARYPSLIHWVRTTALGTSAEAPEQAARCRALWCRLGELVRHVDVLDRGAVDRIRMPLLRQVALSEWGESALSDQAALVLLRAEDRLVAADHRLHRLMCAAIEVLRHASAIEGGADASAMSLGAHANSGCPNK